MLNEAVIQQETQSFPWECSSHAMSSVRGSALLTEQNEKCNF